MQNYCEKHVFPGGNTPLGFFSYYDNIEDLTKAKRVFILKGGPGVGKSSFMKKIANALKQENAVPEYLHCSSDPQSLDGINFIDKGIAVIDGTSPHVVDPVYPGAVDEIINLGEFWERDAILLHKDEIIAVKNNISYEYTRAYKYLDAAGRIDADTNSIYRNATNEKELQKQYKALSDKLFCGRTSEDMRKPRRLFASAVTPAGLVNYSDTVLYPCEHVFALAIGDDLSSFTGADEIMARIAGEAEERGFFAELYYCPMDPKKRIEHIVIPELKAGVTVLNKYSNDETVATDITDLMQTVDRASVRASKDIIRQNDEMYSRLLQYAENALKNAYWLHNTLESYYVPNMDFERINEKCRTVTEDIRNLMRGE